ncbi:hypothetical protein ABEW34_07495 [Paenibacillus algorifonticola]|uniref:hypothetical protein n=1 Tax=Paenibacillus algorifonticola TaxID=684063 RepID=UPI003D285E8B
MAFNLTAYMRIVDQASRPLRTVSKAIVGTAGKLSGLTAGVGALAAAYTGASAAAKLFHSTIGAAAEAEMSTSTITALFKGDEKKAKEYYDFISQKSAESVLSDTDFLNASKSFIIMSKDMDDLRELTNIAERLAILDPMQGLEGAAVALRELNSGDITSLAERFEIPRSVLKEIKNLPLAKQLAALDKELTKYGITQELITAQGQTALGLYRKSVDKTRMTFRDMGFGALEKLKPILRDVNKWLDVNSAAISKFGGNALTGLVSNLVKAIDKGKKYIADNFTNNSKFMKIPTFEGKVEFVFDTVKTSFDKWWEGSGEAAFKGYSEKIVGTLLGSAEGYYPQITSMGLTVGKGIAEGAASGFVEGIKNDPVLALVLGAVAGLHAGGYVGLVVGISIAAAPWVIQLLDYISSQSPAAKGAARAENISSLYEAMENKPKDTPLYGNTSLSATEPKTSFYDKMKDAGSDFLDNPLWLNSLSKKIDEAISGSGKDTPASQVSYAPSVPSQPMPITNNTTVTVNMGGATIREEADVGKIARSLYTMISDANNANAKPGGKRLGGPSEN